MESMHIMAGFYIFGEFRRILLLTRICFWKNCSLSLVTAHTRICNTLILHNKVFFNIIWAATWENRIFAFAKTKTQISFTVTAKLISIFVFATRIVQSLYFLNPKFQVPSYLQWLPSPVCVGPGRKPRRPVFWRRVSYVNETSNSVHLQTCMMPSSYPHINYVEVSTVSFFQCQNHATSPTSPIAKSCICLSYKKLF